MAEDQQNIKPDGVHNEEAPEASGNEEPSTEPNASMKAEDDLASAKDAVSRVAYAQAQLEDIFPKGASYTAASVPEGGQAGVAEESTSAPASAGLQDSASPVIPPQPASPYAAPSAASQGVQQPQPQQTQPQQAGQTYWQGFHPVPAQPQQAIPAQAAPPQAQQAYPTPQAGAQPGQVPAGMVAGQPTQNLSPTQPPQAYGQAGQAAQAPHTVPPQPQPYAQIPQRGPQPQPQPQPYGQTAPQAAYAAQAYTPQLQQPSPYVSAQEFVVQPQPDTPAYKKSNKSTLAIVLVVVVGVIAIIASIIIGRVLVTQASDYASPLYEELSDITEDPYDYFNEFPDGEEYYFDHNWGNGEDEDWFGYNYGDGDGLSPYPDQDSPGYGFGYGPDGDSFDYDPGFDWDLDDSQHGVTHISGGGVEADDGELHSGWDKNVSYSFTEEEFSKESTEKIKEYGNNTIRCDFDVDYPKLTGDIPNLEEINEAIKNTAMFTVDTAYTSPTDEAVALMKNFTEDYTMANRDGIAGILESDVDYAISFNNEDFISITFSDEYALGSWYGEYAALRTLNINLKTGEIYQMEDVLQINEDIAKAFIKNLSKYDDGFALRIAGEKDLVDAILGKGELVNRVGTCFFVDGNGKVNLGVTYQLGGDEGLTRGWWDYTLTDDQLKAAQKDSEMWKLIGQS